MVLLMFTSFTLFCLPGLLSQTPSINGTSSKKSTFSLAITSDSRDKTLRELANHMEAIISTFLISREILLVEKDTINSSGVGAERFRIGSIEMNRKDIDFMLLGRLSWNESYRFGKAIIFEFRAINVLNSEIVANLKSEWPDQDFGVLFFMPPFYDYNYERFIDRDKIITTAKEIFNSIKSFDFYRKSELNRTTREKLVDFTLNLAFLELRNQKFERAKNTIDNLKRYLLSSPELVTHSLELKLLSYNLEEATYLKEIKNAYELAYTLESTWVQYYPELPNPYSCLIALAETRYNGDCGAALKFEVCFKLTYDSIKLNLALGSETQVLYHLQQLDYHFGSVLQIALKNQNPCSKFAELAYDYALMTKGLVLERGDVERNLLNNSPNPILRERMLRIKTLRRDISPIGLSASYAVPNTEMPNVITTLDHEIEKLDHTFPELKHKIIRNYRWKDVYQQLHEDEASIEYLLMPSVNGNPQDTHLLAIVLSKSVGAPIMVKLGAYRELKAIFSKNFESDKCLKPGTTLFRGGEKSNPINSDPLVETPPDLALYNLIIAPVIGSILGIKRVYFSPVDILNFIPFEAIPHPSGKYLGELLELRQVYSTRRLAQPFQDNRSHGRLNVHAFGNINYGKMEFARWRALDETKLEIDSIAFICDTLKYKNVWRYQNHEASEELFNKICTQTTPSILHLATHGFYQPYEDKTKARYIDPMERAGLVLALANQYQPNKNTPSAKNDGWLFASEISQMDLAQVHLAVLSACESGLGDIVQNEGVFGLPRAFLKAGAQTLLVSLWPVEDDEARRFMVKFYENYLPGELSAYDALQITRSFYRNDKELRAKVSSWAAWVLLE